MGPIAGGGALSEEASEQNIRLTQTVGDGAFPATACTMDGQDNGAGQALVFPQSDRVRLQRRFYALLGLTALIVGYGVAVTVVLTLF